MTTHPCRASAPAVTAGLRGHRHIRGLLGLLACDFSGLAHDTTRAADQRRITFGPRPKLKQSWCTLERDICSHEQASKFRGLPGFAFTGACWKVGRRGQTALLQRQSTDRALRRAAVQGRRPPHGRQTAHCGGQRRAGRRHRAIYAVGPGVRRPDPHRRRRRQSPTGCSACGDGRSSPSPNSSGPPS